MVEETLIENGFAKVAKAYILYRRKRQEAREALQVAVDVEKNCSGLSYLRPTGELRKILTLLILTLGWSSMSPARSGSLYFEPDISR